MAEQKEYIVDAANRSLFQWNELWTYRELFYFFTWRDIKVKYKQTALGFLWAILQPLLMMLIFTVFSRAVKIPSQNIPTEIYIFSGLLIWNIFSSGLTNASASMVSNAPIIKKIYFPRLVIPVSSIIVSIFDFLMAFVLFLGILIFYQQPVAWMAVFTWPLALVICVAATLGLGCWIAALNVKYRDFRYVIPFLVQVLFFLTPIIYPVSIISNPVIKYILAASPVYCAVELFRYPLTGILPETSFLLISLSSTLIFLIIGIFYFRKTENFFADFA